MIKRLLPRSLLGRSVMIIVTRDDTGGGQWLHRDRADLRLLSVVDLLGELVS